MNARTAVSLPRLRPIASPAHVRCYGGLLSLLGRKKRAASDPVQSVTELVKKPPAATGMQTAPKRGSLTPPNILDDELGAGVLPATTFIRDPTRHNWGWPRKADAREHRRRGRLTRRELIMQTEKEHLKKSGWFKTSIKKLAPLARQIQGKKLDDAIVQMRFSVKKAARDVLGHLHDAKNEAIVRKMMDPGEMYIDQAWVGRGEYKKEISHRARGRIDMLRLPHTSITVVLKEQATLQRIAREKQAKQERKKPWVQLPSKPIYGQRQYYQW